MSYFLYARILFVIVISSLTLQSQTKNNLDVFKDLVDYSIIQAFISSPDSQNEIFLNLKLGSSYNVFEDQIFQSVKSQNKNVSSIHSSESNSELSYTMENASVTYGEIFRDGFLGEHFIPRKIFISGSYRFQTKTSLSNEFYHESVDTVKYDEIQSLENSSYPFTKGEIPTEPFMSNLFEPLLAITAAAVVIALFFTVRSK